MKLQMGPEAQSLQDILEKYQVKVNRNGKLSSDAFQ